MPPILCLRATERAVGQASWDFIGATLLEQRNAWSMAIFEGFVLKADYHQREVSRRS